MLYPSAKLPEDFKDWPLDGLQALSHEISREMVLIQQEHLRKNPKFMLLGYEGLWLLAQKLSFVIRGMMGIRREVRGSQDFGHVRMGAEMIYMYRVMTRRRRVLFSALMHDRFVVGGGFCKWGWVRWGVQNGRDGNEYEIGHTYSPKGGRE